MTSMRASACSSRFKGALINLHVAVQQSRGVARSSMVTRLWLKLGRGLSATPGTYVQYSTVLHTVHYPWTLQPTTPTNILFGILSDRGTGTWKFLETESVFLHHIMDCVIFSWDNMHIVQGEPHHHWALHCDHVTVPYHLLPVSTSPRTGDFICIQAKILQRH